MEIKNSGIRYLLYNNKIFFRKYLPTVFVGTTSYWWSVHPFKKEIQNGIALQDYSRKLGVTPTLKTYNAQTELFKTCIEHFWLRCIEKSTTDSRSPWENPAEPKIGQLSSMSRNFMSKSKIPLKEHDWAHTKLLM